MIPALSPVGLQEKVDIRHSQVRKVHSCQAGLHCTASIVTRDHLQGLVSTPPPALHPSPLPVFTEWPVPVLRCVALGDVSLLLGLAAVGKQSQRSLLVVVAPRALNVAARLPP